MPDMYVLGKADYIKTVFSGENDGTTTVVSNRLMAMRKCAAPSEQNRSQLATPAKRESEF